LLVDLEDETALDHPALDLLGTIAER